MLFEKKTVKKAQENPYDWPESYYMETDPGRRAELLKEQKNRSSGEEVMQLQSLFDIRYHRDKKGLYADQFMQGWMQLLFMARAEGGSSRSGPAFSVRRKRKEILQALALLQLDHAEHWPDGILPRELEHLLAVYITISMDDRSYTSVMFRLGRLDDETLRRKLQNDLDAVRLLLDKMQLDEEALLLLQAMKDTSERYL